MKQRVIFLGFSNFNIEGKIGQTLYFYEKEKENSSLPIIPTKISKMNEQISFPNDLNYPFEVDVNLSLNGSRLVLESVDFSTLNKNNKSKEVN